ncbi:MAG TPA: thiamine pyrophosphate-binding protein [Candidatus Acidoferrum sp.]|nr:thiamine pyrophosphate-binding protein [Candidatus Acidoferrum sp.]
MRELVSRFLNHGISRREFVRNLSALGFTASATAAILEPLEAMESSTGDLAPAAETTATGSGGELFIAQARAAGVEYLFTNPGSFEVGFFDAVVDDPQIQLIEGLHEGIVISMADGYHKVSGKPAFVNVHSIAGTAQMAGQLYNASRDGSAIVVTAGLNDNEVWSDEYGLAPRPGFDQKEINRQFTKISWEARQPASLALMLRRAFKVATTDPGGPVYLAAAHYALEQKNVSATIYPAERFLLRTRVHADPSAIEKAARLLIEAQHPVIIAGDEVWKSGAQQELLSMAEHLGLPVVRPGGVLLVSAFQNFPTMHPFYLGSSEAHLRDASRATDLIFFVGARDVGGRVVPDSPELPTTARIVRLGMDTSAFSRNYPTDVALISDVKAGLTDLFAAVDSLITKERRTAISTQRADEIRRLSAASRAGVQKQISVNFGHSPIHPDELCGVLADTLDKNAIIVSENLTGKFDSFRFGFRDDEQMHLGNSGSSLGWGIGAAIGAKLAAPDRQVVCSIGDGSVMYSASGFWTQARYRIPILTVVWNNHNYQTVRFAYHEYGGRMLKSGKYAGMYLGDPDIDFVKLAESQGVSGERVTAGSDLRAALRRGIVATRDGKPYLVEVVISRYGGGAESTWHETFDLAARRKRAV